MTLSSASNLDEEDCSYLLRDLEITAFSTVLSAMRAQGVLNKFKEVLLENLRFALFISEDQYKQEMRKAANDEYLSKIAEVLNPSYDTTTSWSTLGCEVPNEGVSIAAPKWFASSTTHCAADDLLQMASSHNDSLADEDSALASLLQLPKTPYVPERLRRLLRDTESLHTDRILPPEPILPEPVAVPLSVKTAAKPAAKGRKRRSKTAMEVKEECLESTSTDNVVCAPLPMSAPLAKKDNGTHKNGQSLLQKTVEPPLLTPQKQMVDDSHLAPIRSILSANKDAENLGVKEFLHKIQQQIQEEALSGQGQPDQQTRKKRKPKQNTIKEPPGCECARARPFLFEPAVNGTKPPRGNPDKRPPKRSPTSSLCFSPTSNEQLPAGQSTPLSTLSGLSSGVPPLSQQSSVISGNPNTTPIALPSGANSNAPVAPTTETSPVSANVGRDANVIVQTPRKQPSPGPVNQTTVVQKGMQQMQQTGVYKRPRVGSFTESGAVGEMSALQAARSNMLKTTRAVPFTQHLTGASPAKPRILSQISPGEHGSSAAAYGNPTRTYYGNPSVAALNRVNQARPVSVASSPVMNQPVGNGSSFGSTEANAVCHGHDYGLTKPVIKRSLYKSGPGSTIRVLNGTSASASPSPRPVQIQQSSSGTNISNNGSSVPATNSQSPSPVGRKLYPLAAHNPQMPVGQYLMSKGSPSMYTSSPAPVESSPQPTFVQQPKRVIYCDPAFMNSHAVIQVEEVGGKFPSSSTSVDNLNDQTQFQGEEFVTTSSTSTISAPSPSNPNQLLPEAGSIPPESAVVDAHPGASTSVTNTVSPSPSMSSTNSNHFITPQPQKYEYVDRVYLVQPSPSTSSQSEELVMEAPEACSTVTIESSAPTELQTDGREAAPVGEADQDRGADTRRSTTSPVVTDILQQSMMEIS